MQSVSAVSYHTEVLGLHPELTVRAVFARAWHLQNRDAWILTVANVPYNGPLAIRVGRSLEGLRVSPGESATLQHGMLAVGGVKVRLDTAREWPAEIARPTGPVSSTAVVENVRQALERVRKANPMGLVAALERSDADESSHSRQRRRDAWLGRAAIEIEGLQRALRHGDEPAAMRHAGGLVGLGPGLTPAGDDFLCGLLAGLRVFGPEGDRRMSIEATNQRHRSSLAEHVVRMARERTTALSRTLLAHAARGIVVEPLSAALETLSSEEGVGGIDSLLAIGHSSGGDMLVGACVAAMIARKREEIVDPAVVAPA